MGSGPTSLSEDAAPMHHCGLLQSPCVRALAANYRYRAPGRRRISAKSVPRVPLARAAGAVTRDRSACPESMRSSVTSGTTSRIDPAEAPCASALHVHRNARGGPPSGRPTHCFVVAWAGYPAPPTPVLRQRGGAYLHRGRSRVTCGLLAAFAHLWDCVSA
jgi:hypothetical protein